jgi:hypothetical protein
MHNVLTDDEQGRLPPMEVERQIEICMDGLERIGLSELHTSRDLLHRLVTADAFDGEEGFCDPQAVGQVLVEFRQFLNRLPGD